MVDGNPRRPLIQSLRIQNLLSYGTKSEEIPLGPLNVLIGPNASGKSNLIEIIGLLSATPRDLTRPIHEGGGIGEWLWKGEPTTTRSPVATVEAVISYPEGITYEEGKMPLRYRISFTEVGQRLELVDEAVEDAHPRKVNAADVYFFYRYQQGHPVLNVRTAVDLAQSGTEQGRAERRLRREDLSLDQSVLSQRKDPDQYQEITYLGNQFSSIRLYREWTLGRNMPARRPQQTDLRNDFLEPDCSNLGLVLNALQKKPRTARLLIENLRKFYAEAQDIKTIIEGGTVQVFAEEKGLHQLIAATRLSDGTLRYLCLLTLLCHPTPPPLLCIEEPELGLHPDVLSTVAELLVEASQRTQLIVTTHSDALVSALTESPESVLVCERDEDGTHLRRLEPNLLKSWLEKYSLGELWRMGEIGGTRW